MRQVEASTNIPRILTNNPEVSRLCFEHLKERGFRHFAYCGFNGAEYSAERGDMCVSLVEQAGLRCHVYAGMPHPTNADTAQYEGLGLQDGGVLIDWIKRLPRPIGLMACNDMRGQQVLDACRSVGVALPDDIAVIGVDNDEVLCNLSNPPLSSVAPNAERIGYEAAALLSRMMDGARIPAGDIFVNPIGIVPRRSTEVLAIDDKQMAAATRFIREHACEGIDVSDVLHAVPMSRSTMDRRFMKILGCSPKDEIVRVRLKRAKQLLAETDLPMALIAEKIGLEHVEHFSRIFKNLVGMTPSAFRTQSLIRDRADRLPASVLFQKLE